jgi:Met-zincin/Domain of unknown function (DUF5117)
MRSVPRSLLLALAVVVCAGAPAVAQPSATKSIADTVKGLTRLDGFMPLYWDEANGKILMEIGRWNTELLYQISLPAGLGSNPVGLDRGALGETHVVVFQRIGPKVLMIEPNYKYRALTQDAAERQAVQDSFAQSVLWGFKVEASEGTRVLVDATALFMRDAFGAIDTLRRTHQGSYRLDDSRSAIYLARTKGFPKNTEIEATLTLVTDGDPGPNVSQVTPSPQAVTLREHHSFVELPPLDGPDAYHPRRVDPRVGVFGIDFHDYASPITEPIEKHWLVRHRLQKKDPNAAISEPVKPIIYYVDNGAPEPIRSALVEGASWWNEAFEAAGFRNAFQVKVLPLDADPMDLRYNVINWVHRSTRGWSYGASVVDPRTGEVLKGHVTLGSLRVRQDIMLGTGMIPTFLNSGIAETDGDGLHRPCDAGDVPDVDYLQPGDASSQDVQAMALARIRQLSAHEVGHTLGFAHNFAASTDDRASVMDYPAPNVEIRNGALDLSNAYGRGIGAYDKWAVRFAYVQFAPGADERVEIERVVEEGINVGLPYITDEDARPAGAAHPLANLWDNGSDPVAMLRHEMQVRQIGLSQFGLKNVPTGSPLSLLEAKLLPLYLHHRFQLTAALKEIGGATYSYAVRTPAGPSPASVQEIVAPEKQRDALKAVLETITPEALDVPDRVLSLIPPKAFSFGSVNTELFTGRTDPVFDPLAAASIAADMAISGLLQYQRAGRLITFHAQQIANPGFKDVVDALIAQIWSKSPLSPRLAAIRRIEQHLLMTRLIDLAAQDQATPQARADATAALRVIQQKAAEPQSSVDAAQRAMQQSIRDDIDRFLKRPDATFKPIAPLPTPPGDPIGTRGAR